MTAARQNGIRLLGPNCLGIINTDPQVSLNGSFARLMPATGNIALVSQSGAVGVAALEYAQGEGIGLSKFVSVGNKADLNENDFLAYLKDDPLTDVIMFYLEDLADPKRFFQLAREITGEAGNKKPILAIKSGRTAAGARAASSHTGALAGSDEAYDALFAQCGVLRVESLEELFDYAQAFSTQPLPRGNRVAIVTNAGGLGIMTTDAAVRYGLSIAEFKEETVARLKAGLPAAANIHNPVDVLGDAREDRYRTALEGVLGDDHVDGVIVISTPQLMTNLAAIAATVAEVTPAYHKPTLVCQMALGEIEETLAIWSKAKLPHYHFPEEAVRSLGAMARYAANIHRDRYEVKTFADVDRDQVKEVLQRVKAAGRKFVLEPEAHEIFQAYGFPVAPFAWVHSEDQAVRAAADLGYPVALKIVSPDVIHKFDVGGVKLNLETDGGNPAGLRRDPGVGGPGPSRGRAPGHAGAENGSQGPGDDPGHDPGPAIRAALDVRPGGHLCRGVPGRQLQFGAHLRGLGPENDPGTQGLPHPEELPGRTPGGFGGHRGVPGAPLPDGPGFCGTERTGHQSLPGPR